MYMTGFADEASPSLDIQSRVTKELGWRMMKMIDTIRTELRLRPYR